MRAENISSGQAPQGRGGWLSIEGGPLRRLINFLEEVLERGLSLPLFLAIFEREKDGRKEERRKERKKKERKSRGSWNCLSHMVFKGLMHPDLAH